MILDNIIKPIVNAKYTMIKDTIKINRTTIRRNMTRSTNIINKKELATNDIRPVHLITIGFGTPVNITDCSFSLTSSVSGSSVTYVASDFIMGVSDFTEETDVTLSSNNINTIRCRSNIYFFGFK